MVIAYMNAKLTLNVMQIVTAEIIDVNRFVNSAALELNVLD